MNNFWWQLYGHRSPITKPMKVRWTRHTGHRVREVRNELINDIILWTPTHVQAKAGRPAKTYLQQLCANTGFSLEDLPGAMDDRDGWRQRVREIRAGTATSWWWPIDRTLSGATTPGQRVPGSDGNERVLNIPQSRSITETSLSDWRLY